MRPYHVVLRGSVPPEQDIVVPYNGNVLILGTILEVLGNLDGMVNNICDAAGLKIRELVFGY